MSEITNYKYYVGGQFVQSTSGNLIEIICPYDQSVIGRVQAISKEEADVAIAATKAAQKVWADTDLFKRADLLNKWADQLEIDAEEIAQMIMREVGKTWNDAVKEVTRTAEFIRYTVQEFIHTNDAAMSGANYPGGSKNKFAIIKRIPLGTVLAISPFNYPVNLSVAKLAPALIAGNAVVFKPATQGAISAVKLIESFDKVGFPADILQLITGKGSDIGDYVSEHDGIDMISFTGGATTGRHLSSFSTMLGIVTVDDIIDVIDDEAQSDYSGLAGVNTDNVNQNPVQSAAKRLPWLVALLFLGMGTASLIDHFDGLVSKASVLAIFISLITGTAGNAGTQSLAVSVRRISLNDEGNRSFFSLILAEIATGLVTGAVTGLTVFLVVSLWKGNMILGLAVGVAMRLGRLRIMVFAQSLPVRFPIFTIIMS